MSRATVCFPSSQAGQTRTQADHQQPVQEKTRWRLRRTVLTPKPRQTVVCYLMRSDSVFRSRPPDIRLALNFYVPLAICLYSRHRHGHRLCEEARWEKVFQETIGPPKPQDREEEEIQELYNFSMLRHPKMQEKELARQFYPECKKPHDFTHIKNDWRK